MSVPRRALVGPAAVLAAALLLAGCGSGSTGAAAELAPARGTTAPDGTVVNLTPNQNRVTTPEVDAKDDGLVRALNAAIDEVIRNGTYGQVLKRWGLDNEAVKASEVNPPGLPKPKP